MKYESMSTWERLFSHRKQKDDRLERINILRIQLSEIDHKVVSRSCQTSRDKARQPDVSILQCGQTRRRARLSEYKKSHFPTFKPSILAESEAIARRTGWTSIPVEERLIQHTKPKLTPRSVTESSRPSSTDLSRSFISRLGEYEASRVDKASLRRDIENQTCTFVPKIDPNSRAKCLQSGRVSNTFERLAVEDPKQRSKRQAVREQPTCRFSPQIDPYSEILAVSKRAIDPGYCVYAPKVRAGKLPPVSPVVTPRVVRSKKYAHVTGKYNFRNPDEILLVFDESRRLKEAKNEHAKWEKAELELKECTFQPNVEKVNIKQSNKGRPVLISGLDRFLAHTARRPSHPSQPLQKRPSGRLTVPAPFVFRN